MELYIETLQELFNQLIFLFKTTLSATKKNSFYLSLTLFILLSACTKKSENKLSSKNNKSFKFNLPYQVFNTDPQLTRGTAANFTLFNLHRGLVYYNQNNKLTYWGAKKCEYNNDYLKLTCVLNNKKFHDGSNITSQHYINSIKNLFITKTRQLEYLKKIIGFDSYLNTRNDKSFLEVTAPDERTLIFSFRKPDLFFLDKLTHLVFTPRKEFKSYQNKDVNYYSGPYSLKELSSTSMTLTNNIHYNEFLRPDVTAFFVEESQASLNMYETEEIDFLRFLPTQDIPNYKNSGLLLKSFLARLDGIVLSEKALKDINLRKALTYSLDFSILKKIFSSESDPGCPPLPDTYFKESKPPCFKYNLKKAKKYFKSVKLIPPKIQIFIPKMESNDHLKMAEWAQESWREHLGLRVSIEQLEAGVLREKVKRNHVPIYRKGFNLQQPGCLSSLSNLESSSPSNFLKLNLKKLDDIIINSRPETFTKEDCSNAFKLVLDQYLWIPTGQLYFTHLHSKNYEGYTINSINQFDLTNLKLKRLE